MDRETGNGHLVWEKIELILLTSVLPAEVWGHENFMWVALWNEDG